MNLLPSVLSAAKLSDALAAAGQPVADEIVQKALTALQDDEKLALASLAADEQTALDAVTAKIIPALQQALTNVLDGLTITISINKKGAA